MEERERERGGGERETERGEERGGEGIYIIVYVRTPLFKSLRKGLYSNCILESSIIILNNIIRKYVHIIKIRRKIDRREGYSVPS